MWRYVGPVSKFLLSYAFSILMPNTKKQDTDNNWKINHTQSVIKDTIGIKLQTGKCDLVFPALWMCELAKWLFSFFSDTMHMEMKRQSIFWYLFIYYYKTDMSGVQMLTEAS